MGMKTVAEWVSSNEALTHRRAFGVDYAQGFGVGGPIHLAGQCEAGLQNVVSILCTEVISDGRQHQ